MLKLSIEYDKTILLLNSKLFFQQKKVLCCPGLYIKTVAWLLLATEMFKQSSNRATRFKSYVEPCCQHVFSSEWFIPSTKFETLQLPLHDFSLPMTYKDIKVFGSVYKRISKITFSLDFQSGRFGGRTGLEKF